MTFTIVFFGWIFFLCLHEFLHALVAYYGGDYTVREKAISRSIPSNIPILYFPSSCPCFSSSWVGSVCQVEQSTSSAFAFGNCRRLVHS